MPKKRKIDMLQTPALKAEKVPEVLKPVEPLTDRQFECLKFIYGYFITRRFYPTQREIAEALGVRSNTAAFFTGPIEKKGYLHVEPGRRRNIRLTPLAIKLLTEKGVIKEETQIPLPV